MSDRPWSDEDRETLRRMWLDGESASSIGRVLRRTRNSVLGVVHRSKNLPKRVATPTRARAQQTATRQPRPVVMKAEETKELLPIEPPLLIRDLKDEHCRWAHDIPNSREYRYCGHARDGASWYCPFHSKIVFLPRPPRGGDKRAG